MQEYSYGPTFSRSWWRKVQLNQFNLKKMLWKSRVSSRPGCRQSVLKALDSGRSESELLKNHSPSTQSEYLLSMIQASSSYLWTISRMCRSSKFGDVYPDTKMMSPSFCTSVQQIHRLNSMWVEIDHQFLSVQLQQSDWQNLELVPHERKYTGLHAQLWWVRVVLEECEPLHVPLHINGGAFSKVRTFSRLLFLDWFSSWSSILICWVLS